MANSVDAQEGQGTLDVQQGQGTLDVQVQWEIEQAMTVSRGKVTTVISKEYHHYSFLREFLWASCSLYLGTQLHQLMK
jgi:hypothetical protein